MTVAELESILGPPDSKNDKVDRKNLDLGEGGSGKIVEYQYSARHRLRDAQTEYKGIFVDEDRLVGIDNLITALPEAVADDVGLGLIEPAAKGLKGGGEMGDGHDRKISVEHNTSSSAIQLKYL